MILNLPFKKLWYYQERPVEVRLRIGSLEDLCEERGIKFWQLKEEMNKNNFDFAVDLLYYSYKTACEKRHTKPEYTKLHASVWYEHMSASERLKFSQEMSVLFGKVVANYKSEDKKKVKPNGAKSNPSHSENSDGAGKDGEMRQ